MNIPARWRRYAGVTMVELLVAMVIGIFLIAGAVSIFIASKRSYTEVERSGRMIENARYAQQALSMDLRHGGFFGEAAPPGIDLDDELDDVEDDCTGGLRRTMWTTTCSLRARTVQDRRWAVSMMPCRVRTSS